MLAVFNTQLGKELLFRRFLVQRMRGAFSLAYPSRRFQSAWMGIVVHSTQSLVIIAGVLAVVRG